jgi:uncharacterized protein (TIGR03437 family)
VLVAMNRARRALRATLCAAWLACSVSAWGQVNLSIGASTGVPGSITSASVLQTATGASPSALQFDLVWQEPGMDMSLANVAGSGKNVYAVRRFSNSWRVILASPGQTTFPPGAVLNLTITLPASDSLAPIPIQIQNASAAAADGTSLNVGTTDGVITLQSSAPSSAPAVTVLNGATFLPGAVAANELVSIYVPATRTSGGDASGAATVTFGVATAQVLYAGNGQFNAVVPANVSQPSTDLSVAGGGFSVTTSLPVASASPGLFTANGTGLGQVSAVNADGTPNSPAHPAASGSALVLYATGVLAQDLQVSIGKQAASIISVGTNPGALPGVVAITVQVPSGAGTNSAASVTLAASGVTSLPGTTVAVVQYNSAP